MGVIGREQLRDLAAAADIAVTGVTTAEPFGPELENALVSRIREGRLNGLSWFTEERARQSIDPRFLHPTAQSIITIGVPYRQPDIRLPDDNEPRGRISRYAWGRDYHRILKERMRDLHGRLERAIGRRVEARYLVDTARIVDRAAAARSGLGWYGKNTMILSPGYGSWLLLGELVVDVDIAPDPPLRPKCGRCTGCLDGCPTGALVGNYTVDTPRCISFLTIELRGPIPLDLRPLMGDWVFGCDVCQEVCPYTRAASPADDPAFQPVELAHAFPSLHWLLRITESEFRQTYRGMAVLRAKRSGLARNAAVALGNNGNASDLAVLEEALIAHDEPLVRGHAAWAMARIDWESAAPALTRRLTREPDPYVRREITAALTELAPAPARLAG